MKPKIDIADEVNTDSDGTDGTDAGVKKVTVPDAVKRKNTRGGPPPPESEPEKPKAPSDLLKRDDKEDGYTVSMIKFGDFMAESIDAPVELVEDIIFEGTVNVLAAASKTGKTWFDMDLGLSVAAGVPFLGKDVEQGRVLFVNPEVSPYYFQNRLFKLTQDATDEQRASLMDNFCLINARGSLPNGTVPGEALEKFLAGVKVAIKKNGGKPFKLIVFDSIYKLLGNLEENSNTDQALAANLLDAFLVSVGNPAALCVYHFSKGNQANKDSIDRVVGAGSTTRSCDCAITITGAEKVKTDGHYSMEVVNRNSGVGTDMVIKFDRDTCRWVKVEGEDPKKLYKPGTFTKTYTDADVQSVITGEENRKTPSEWHKALVELGGPVSKISLRTLKGRIAAWKEHDAIEGTGDEGYFVECNGDPLHSLKVKV